MSTGPKGKGGKKNAPKNQWAEPPKCPTQSQSVARLTEGVSKVTIGGGNKPPVPGSKLSSFPPKPPRKPGDKGPGRPVHLISNLFRLKISHNKPIYKYSVEIDRVINTGDVPKDETKVARTKISKELRQDILRKAISDYVKETRQPANSYYVFETGASVLYTLSEMFSDLGDKSSSKSKEITVNHSLPRFVNKTMQMTTVQFVVKIFPGGPLELGLLEDYCKRTMPLEALKMTDLLRAVNAIVRGQLVLQPTYVLTNTSVFPMDERNRNKIGPGVIATRGFYISPKVSETGLILNVANTVGAFLEPINLVELLKQRFRVDPGKPIHSSQLEAFKKEIINKQVEARHLNYGKQNSPHYGRYRIGGLGGSAMDVFTLADEKTKEVKQITIKDYFKQKYNYPLKYPHLPCVIDKNRKIPLEVCHLVDKQRLLRRTDPNETAEMIKISALPADRHFQQIDRNMKDIEKNQKSMMDFGIKLDYKNIELEGRELPPHSLLGSQPIKASNGQYDPKFSKFSRPATISRWAIAFLDSDDISRDLNNPNFGRDKDRFIQLYSGEANLKGVKLGSANFQVVPMVPEKLKQFVKYLNDNNCDHCIFILPSRIPDSVYPFLQYLEASFHGNKCTRITCVRYSNYKRKIIEDRFNGKMFLGNLILKYNSKLGGVNFCLSPDPKKKFLQEGYIFVSIDVCHPSPGDKLIQSVAAVVGMWDVGNCNMSTSTRLRVQKKMHQNSSTIEQVLEVGQMFAEIVGVYFEKKKKLPSKIVIMRDGVSEGQLSMVVDYEIGRIQQALSSLYQKRTTPHPSITCMVVQKRHKTRFRRSEPFVDRKGNDYNIQPGTTVDNTVTHPVDFTYFQAPHKAIQGTSRPPHFYVVLNQIPLDQDEAQDLSHCMSYLSPRCSKSTAIPTPVNLADLAAERGKNLVVSWVEDNKQVKMSEDERITKLNQFLSNLGDKNYLNTLFYI